MQYFGQISKMKTTLSAPINYMLPIGKKTINVNNLIGSNIRINFEGEIQCIACSKKIYKTFMQGYCYPCHCLTTTYVYLSLTSNLKVGVTRENHIPSRWIDQGAHFAIKFAKAPNRYLAGMIEIELSKYISDRTKWRQMIQGKYDMIDLIDKKNELINSLPKNYQKYVIPENNLVELQYPLNASPEKIKSFNLDKNPELYGELTGIKGQYLIIDNEIVLNIRKYTGYFISIDYE